MKWKFLILMLALVFTGGILNYKELNELAIVSSIGIDKAEDGNYKVSVQVMNSKKADSGSQSSGSDAQITVYKKEAQTVQAALRSMINESPKKLHLAHLEIIVISEELAKDGIKEDLDFFIRNTDINHEFSLLIAKEGSSAEDVIATLTTIEMNPTQNLLDSLKAACIYEGTTVDKTISDMQDQVLKEFDETVITSIILEGDPEDGKDKENIEGSETKSKVLISEMGYFKEDKLQGYITKEEAKIFNMLNNTLKNTIIEVSNEKYNVAAFEIIKSDCKYKVKMQDNNFYIDIDLSVISNLSEVKSELEFQDLEKIEILENDLKKHLESSIYNYLYKIQNEYKSDINGFGDKLYKKYNLKFKEKSDGYLQKIKFNVNVEVSLKNEGGVLNKW